MWPVDWWRRWRRHPYRKPPAKPPTTPTVIPLTRALRLPQSTWEPIPVTSSDPVIIPVGDVFHVAVSNTTDLHDFFEHDGGIESTGYILKDGSVKQYRELNIQCDAQFGGNGFTRADGRLYGFNSWESQGLADEQWTDAQIATIQRIIRFKHQSWGNPLRQCPAWNLGGFGYHSLFAQWNLSGHSCPGPARILQWQHVIVPWLKAGAP